MDRPIKSTAQYPDRPIELSNERANWMSSAITSGPIGDQEDEWKLGHVFVSIDELEEINIGNGDKPSPTFISKSWSKEFKDEMIELLRGYKDCFAWDYSEMPGLSRSIVEHRLPIKPGYRPYQQPPHKVDPKIHNAVKKEITRLFEAGFIRPW